MFESSRCVGGYRKRANLKAKTKAEHIIRERVSTYSFENYLVKTQIALSARRCTLYIVIFAVIISSSQIRHTCAPGMRGRLPYKSNEVHASTDDAFSATAATATSYRVSGRRPMTVVVVTLPTVTHRSYAVDPPNSRTRTA